MITINYKTFPTVLILLISLVSCSVWDKSHEFDQNAFPEGTSFYVDTSALFKSMDKITNDYVKEKYDKLFLFNKQKGGTRRIYAKTQCNGDTLSYYTINFIKDNSVSKSKIIVYDVIEIEHTAFSKKTHTTYNTIIKLTDSTEQIESKSIERTNPYLPYNFGSKKYKPRRGQITEQNITKKFVRTAKEITKDIHYKLIKLGNAYAEHKKSSGKDTVNRNIGRSLHHRAKNRQDFYEFSPFSDSISLFLIDGVDMNRILDFQIQIKDVNTKDELLSLNPIDFVPEFTHDPEHIDYFYFLAATYKKCFLLTGNLIHAYTYKTAVEEISKRNSSR